MTTKNPLISDTAATIAEQTRAAIERGEDPFGDDEDVAKNPPVEGSGSGEGSLASADADAGDEGSDDAPAGAADGEGSETDASTAAESDTPPAEEVATDGEPELPTYEVRDRDYQAELTTLSAKEDEIEKAWSSGELTDEQRAAQLKEVRTEIRSIEREQIREETKAELNQQAILSSQKKVLARMAINSKAAGELDYGDQATASAFDAMFKAVRADPANKDLSYAQRVEKTHNALCAARGITRKAVAAPATAPAPAPAAARTPPQAPVTLRGVPNAAVSNTGGSRVEAIGKLTGQAYQEAFAKLSPAEKAALLDE